MPDVVSYTLTRWDRFRTLVRMQGRSRVIRIVAAGAVLVNVWLAFRNGEGESVAVKAFAAVLQLAFVFAVLAATMVLTALITAFLTTDRSVVGPITLTFSDEGFTAESGIGKSFLKWAGLHSILVAGGFIYIRIADTKFIGIPERAFPDARSAALFAASLRSRLETAKKNAAA